MRRKVTAKKKLAKKPIARGRVAKKLTGVRKNAALVARGRKSTRSIHKSA